MTGACFCLVGGFSPTHLKNMRTSNWIISLGRDENEKNIGNGYIHIPTLEKEKHRLKEPVFWKGMWACSQEGI